jgi:hypothetical protein
MRRQAAPFAVEVKKRKGRSASGTPLLGKLDAGAVESERKAAATAAAEELFRSRPQRPQAEGPAKARSGREKPSRILPDLTVRPAAPAPDAELGKRRKALQELPRPARPASAKAAARPSGLEPRRRAAEPAPAAPARVQAARQQVQPPRDIRARRSRRAQTAEVLLGAGERWKRRLPPQCW